MQHWDPDPQVKGLYKRIGTTKTVWAVKARIKGGPPVTVTLGRVDSISTATARRKAHESLALLAEGINPNEQFRDSQKQIKVQKENEQARKMTLREAREKYLALKDRKPSTVKCLIQTTERNFGDWLDQPLNTISRNDVLSRYKLIRDRVAGGKRSKSQTFTNAPGEGEAQKAFRYLRSICSSFGSDIVGGRPLLESNPVEVLKDKKIRTVLKPRKRYLTPTQIEELAEVAVKSSHPEWKGDTRPEDADFVMLLLMTGLRVDELRTLKWVNVDFREGIMRAIDTKNHNEHTLPLTGSISSILKNRIKLTNKSLYVFPSPNTPQECASMSRVFQRVCSDVGYVFTAHDLRRTFATVASEMGVDVVKISAALNHTKSDVTSRYIQTTPQMLSDTLQAVQDAIFKPWQTPVST